MGLDLRDVVISVNGDQEGFIDPNDITIEITDGVDPVTPDSVTINGSEITIQVPAASAPIGATLPKTGQTISYRTGDDGDLEAGRATSFLVLSANNPFGNTNRFTDELGGTSYTNNIVIDWSTYDGATVLGYKRTLNGSLVAWNSAIDGALTVSIGSFTSGWKLVNIKELMNILNWGSATGRVLDYAPFNLSTQLNLWSSTTNVGTTGNAMFLGDTYSGHSSGLDKTVAACQYMACRIFTVTGTTLT